MRLRPLLSVQLVRRGSPSSSKCGVPDAPGYLDYEYTDSRATGGVDCSSLSVDPANDGTRDQADAAWNAKYRP